jgi:hypothetical protein
MSEFKGTYSLSSCHGRYISCDSNESRAPRADETECRSEEIWRLYVNPATRTLSFQGQVRGGQWRYLSAPNRDDIRCNAHGVGGQEQFTPTQWQPVGDGAYNAILRTSHGRYVRAKPPNHGKPQVDQSDNQQQWEVITIRPRNKEDRKFWDDFADVFNGKPVAVSIPL